jgi:hypothetical protein
MKKRIRRDKVKVYCTPVDYPPVKSWPSIFDKNKNKIVTVTVKLRDEIAR